MTGKTNTLPAPEPDWALFLDFDGTLAHIAATPCAANVEPRLPATLAALVEVLDGAVALVSGRSLAELDDLLAPMVLPAAGVHGLERRRADGTIVRVAEPSAALAVVRERLRAFAAGAPGVLLEDKGMSLALHYRNARDRDADCRLAAYEALAAGGAGLHLIEGKMIYEIQSDGADKGTAIEAFLAEPPFAGRRPAFFGDDVTDEDGFAAVNRRGGVTVRVGDGAATAARWRIDTVGALLDWLERAPAAIAGTPAGRQS